MSDETRTRRQVLKAAAGGAIALTIPALSQTPPKPPSLPGDMVKEFVIAGHGNLKRVQEMLTEQPGLLNACWDWGGGDFETAIEGAGHVGNKEIARFLVSKGARLNIIQAAMLGELELVQAMLRAHPELASAKGPHGIPLLAHAKAGGAEAQPVFDFLEKLR